MRLIFEIEEHPVCKPEDFPVVQRKEGWEESTGKGRSPFDALTEAYELVMNKIPTHCLLEKVFDLFHVCANASALATCDGDEWQYVTIHWKVVPDAVAAG